MNVKELEDILNTAIVILQDNKKIATPETLSGIEAIVSHLNPNAEPQPVSFNETLEDILSGVTKVIDIEKRLTQTTMTDNLVRILTNIQNRPIIMHLLARFL